MSKELFMTMRENEVAHGISFEHLIDAIKENLQTAVAKIKESVLNGETDELKALIMAKKGVELFSLLEKAVRPLAEDKYIFKIGKDYSVYDVKVEEAETGVRYDYSACNDAEWNDLNTQITELDEKKKSREALLKTVTKKLTVVDENSGEVTEILPVVRSGKMGLKLTIK